MEPHIPSKKKRAVGSALTCIGLWTSSSPSKKLEYQKGIARLKELNVQTLVPSLVKKNACKAASKNLPFLAGPDQDKADSLEEIWNARETNTLFATRGGYGALRLLPLLDKIKVLSHPKKILWGYSDLTVIQQYLHARNGGPWVHSPMLSSASFYKPNKKEATRWKRLTNLDSNELNMTDCYDLKIVHASSSHRGKSQMRAPIIGGNLASLMSLMGTPWEFRIPPKAWLFLEEVQESAYRLDRLLTQLSYHRDFKNLDGVVLGHFTKCDGHKNILKAWAKDKDKTLISGIPAGHESPNLPIVLGEAVHFGRKSQNTYTLELSKPKFGVRVDP